MNALQSYSSDNESDNEYSLKKTNKMADYGTNYDDVGMDISEDSGDNDDAKTSTQSTDSSRTKSIREKDVKKDNSDSLSSSKSASDDTINNDKKEQSDRKRGRSSSSRERSMKEKEDRYSNSGNRRDRSRERSSKETYSRTPRDHKDGSSRHRSSDCRRNSRDDRHTISRRSRSRSRDRRRSRSKSRSRSRERRRRRTRSRSRSRSRDRDRRRPHEIRKEAQQKIAAFKASNPDFDHNEMLKKGMEAQLAEVQKNTGLTLPSYYNPAVMNPLKIAEQERKKKLLWGNKNKTDTTGVPSEVQQSAIDDPKKVGLWANTKFSNDSDGKMAEKFKRLMGLKSRGAGPSSGRAQGPGDLKGEPDILQKQESLFSSMEKQYEVARIATHTHKGFGLGFSSQPYVPK